MSFAMVKLVDIYMIAVELICYNLRLELFPERNLVDVMMVMGRDDYQLQLIVSSNSPFNE